MCVFLSNLTSLLTLLQDRVTAVRYFMPPDTVVYTHQPGNGLGGYIRTNHVLQIVPQYT